jgi:hypothetical protein
MTFERIIRDRPADGGRTDLRWWIVSDGNQAVHLAVMKRAGETYPGVERPTVDGWSGADVGYHSRTQLHEGQDYGACDLFDGDRCFYDGSYLAADTLIAAWASQGGRPDALWGLLEQLHRTYFDPAAGAAPPEGRGAATGNAS